MAQTFWTSLGDFVVDDQGRPILCDECPCTYNTCNSCIPPIPDALYVTFAGLGGDFAAANGKQQVLWPPTDNNPRGYYWIRCVWEGKFESTPVLHTRLVRIWLEFWKLKLLNPSWDNEWHVYVEAGTLHSSVWWEQKCTKMWDLIPGPYCDPVGEYSESLICEDSYCPDDSTNTCPDSAGATCVVSLT